MPLPYNDYPITGVAEGHRIIAWVRDGSDSLFAVSANPPALYEWNEKTERWEMVAHSHEYGELHYR